MNGYIHFEIKSTAKQFAYEIFLMQVKLHIISLRSTAYSIKLPTTISCEMMGWQNNDSDIHFHILVVEKFQNRKPAIIRVAQQSSAFKR